MNIFGLLTEEESIKAAETITREINLIFQKKNRQEADKLIFNPKYHVVTNISASAQLSFGVDLIKFNENLEIKEHVKFYDEKGK